MRIDGRQHTDSAELEELAREAFPALTVVRCSWFAQNFSESFLREPVLAGEVALPVADMREPFIDAEDIADVATAALIEAGHTGETYELTGPALMTFADAVDAIAEASGRSVTFRTVVLDEYAAALVEHGLDDDAIGLIRYLFTEVLDGRNARLADGVERALGRPPRPFREYAERAAAAGAWAAARAAEAASI